jgi:hypothetical protein
LTYPAIEVAPKEYKQNNKVMYGCLALRDLAHNALDDDDSRMFGSFRESVMSHRLLGSRVVLGSVVAWILLLKEVRIWNQSHYAPRRGTIFRHGKCRTMRMIVYG